MFNECSLKTLETSQQANAMLQQFITALIRAKELGLLELRLHEVTIVDLYHMTLSADYNIDDWLKNPNINPDLKSRFREFFTTFPLISEEELNDDNLFQRSQFYFDLGGTNVEVFGLGASFVSDTLAVSLYTHETWNTEKLEITHYYLTLDGSGQEKQGNVKNFSCLDTLEKHRTWLEKFQLDHLVKSAQLWKDRETLFPNLKFTDDVEHQIKRLGISSELNQIFNRLKTLNEYAKCWTEGSFSIDHVNASTNLRVSMESPSTMRLYGSQRKFKIQGRNQKDIFEPHIKTGNFRFHFYADEKSKTIYIGYIGKHLRIFSEN